MSRLLRNIFMFVVYAYLYIPIIILVTNSFNADRYGLSWKGFSWNWYERLFNNDTLIQAAIHSVTIAFFAATLATIVGGLTAIALYRYRFRGKQAVSGMLFIVMMSPDIVMAVSLLALFMVVGISLGFWSLLLAHSAPEMRRSFHQSSKGRPFANSLPFYSHFPLEMLFYSTFLSASSIGTFFILRICIAATTR